MATHTLLQVCQEWLIENGKPEAQRDRIYTIGLSGLRELHLDVNGVVKIVELCINDNDTVDLPNDFINYRKIGIVGADGNIHCLGRDNDMSLAPACGIDGRANVPWNNSDALLYGLPLNSSFWGGNYGNGGVFGIGGGNNMLGYYKVNKATNQIWLSNLGFPVGCTIIVEYIADLSNGGGDDDFIIHPYAIDVVKQYIAWKYVLGDRNTSVSEKEIRRREYFNSLRICKNRYGSSTPEEWASSLRASNSASVRF